MRLTRAKPKPGRRAQRVRHKIARKVDVHQPALFVIPVQPKSWRDPEQRKNQA